MKSLSQAVGIVFNDCGGRVQNCLRGAVIFFEANDLGVGKILGEAFEVSRARAAPAVDGLILVAYHADIFPRAGEEADDFFLRAIGVLKLVNH